MRRKIYLSSMFERHEEMDRIAVELCSKGHEVTSRWHTDGWIKMCQSGNNGIDDSVIARVDIADMSYADTMIIFTEPRGTHGNVRGGRHVEFGMAVERSFTRKMSIIRVGPAENVFHHMDVFEKIFATTEDMLQWI